MKLFFIIGVLFFSNFCFSQKQNMPDTLNSDSKRKIICIFYKKRQDIIKQDCSKPIVELVSPGDSLYCFVKGEVRAVHNLTDFFAVTIYSMNNYYTYSGLKSVFVKKGQQVILNSVLGILISDEADCDEFIFDFLISDSKARMYCPDEPQPAA